MHLSPKQHPYLFAVAVAFVLVLYAVGYATEGHKKASAVLRASPHSYTTLIIVRYRWTESRTYLRYIALSANGWGSPQVQFDAETGAVVLN